MTRKRSRKKLTAKEANRISLLSSGSYLIIMVINGLISKPVGQDFIIHWILGCCIGPLLFYVLLYCFIFDVEGKQLEEELENIKIKTLEFLSKSDLTEVDFIYEDKKSSAVEMMKAILQKEGCRYYAKLSEDNTIILIVKDKYDKEVYNTEIYNCNYFYTNFQLKG